MKKKTERCAKTIIRCMTVMTGILLLMCSLRPRTIYGALTTDGGIDNGIRWEINGDTLTLRAADGSSGSMVDYYDRTAPWVNSECAAAVKKIVVKYGVTRLGGASLGFDHMLDLVVIPGSVQTIEVKGPVGWDIRVLRFEEGVRSISEWSFGDGIDTVIFPESIISVNVHAFGYPTGSGWVNGVKNVFGYPNTAAEKYVRGSGYPEMRFWDRNKYILPEDDSTDWLENVLNETKTKGKQKQNIRISSKITTTVTYTTTLLKKQSASFKIGAKAKGKITYKVTKGKAKYISVTKKGKVTLQKGCPKGTYQITVSAAATKNYKAAKTIITVKVKKPKKYKAPKETFEDNSGFLKYVYTNREGLVCFRYTGSGKKRIIVPEGVHVIEGFTSSAGFNDEITYIYIPSTVTKIGSAAVFHKQAYGWDSGVYSVLYQCRNLQNVEVSGDSLQFTASADGTKLIQIGGKTIWSKSVKLPLK